MLEVRNNGTMQTLILGLCIIALSFYTATSAEPGFRAYVSPGVLKLTGEVGDNVGIGAGGSTELVYRMSENFGVGAKWLIRYQLGSSSNTIDNVEWEDVYLNGAILVARFSFNPDNTSRPMGIVGMGLSWLHWHYPEPFSPPEAPDYSITFDRLTATTFLLGLGMEADIGEYWEFCPVAYLYLNSWRDHTYQGLEPYRGADDEFPVAPQDASFLLEVSLARRF